MVSFTASALHNFSPWRGKANETHVIKYHTDWGICASMMTSQCRTGHFLYCFSIFFELSNTLILFYVTFWKTKSTKYSFSQILVVWKDKIRHSFCFKLLLLQLHCISSFPKCFMTPIFFKARILNSMFHVICLCFLYYIAEESY